MNATESCSRMASTLKSVGLIIFINHSVLIFLRQLRPGGCKPGYLIPYAPMIATPLQNDFSNKMIYM